MKIKALCIALLFSACSLSMFAQPDSASIVVKQMPDQPLPVTISRASLNSFQATSQLEVQLALEKGAEPLSVEFLLVLYRNGKAISGEGWHENAPGESFLRQTTLAIQPGDQALLVVNSVASSSRTLTLNANELHQQIHAFMEGRPPMSVPVEVSMNVKFLPKLVRAQATPCDAAIAAAIMVCGAGQVQSFSCTPTTGMFSFTCKGPKPVQP